MKLSIYDAPPPAADAGPQAMPLKLKLVIGALLAFIPFEVWSYTSLWPDNKNLVRIGICVLAVVFLFRGSDLARALVRGLSAVGAVVGVLAFTSLGSLLLPKWFMVITGASIALYAFIFWALGQEDVKSWMRWRSTPSSTPQAIASFGGGRTR